MTVNSGYGFPYPLSSEPVANGASNIQSLADAVDSKMGLFKVIPTGAIGGTVTSDGDVSVNSAVGSVTVQGAFSALYDNYLISYSGGKGSTGHVHGIQLQTSGGVTSSAAYYGGFATYSYANAPTGAGFSNSTAFAYCGGGESTWSAIWATLIDPFKAEFTKGSYPVYYGSYAGQVAAVHALATSYSNFVVTPSVGTMTGGTIRIYGYRN